MAPMDAAEMTQGTSEASAALLRDGYVILQDVLSSAQVDAITGAVRPLLDATPRGRNDFEGTKTLRVYNLVGKTSAVHALVMHPAVIELVAGHIGPPGFQLSIAQAIEIHPGETAQQLHTDDLPFPIPKPHQPVVVNTMWALTEFTRANGATRLAPSSRGSARPPSEDECVHAELTPGSVLVWDGSMWHGGGANTTAFARLGLAINFQASWLRQQENQYLAIPESMLAEMPEELRRIVGYELCGVLGSVDGRHPIKGARPAG